MNDQNRCPECGSWGEQCGNDGPQEGCGCARCAGDALAAVRVALRESERKRVELEAVLQDFLQGKDPKLAKKIAPLWVPARVVSVQTESGQALWTPSWVADLRGDGPIPPSILAAFNSPGGDVQIATRIPTAIIRVGGKVLAEVEAFSFTDE